jgi:2-polyprenyl-3-methyl-5-hydroxy-6-metoxy-1,4-benzoquinol methylase
MMTPETFFQLFLEELKNAPELRSYYRVLNSRKGFAFRKAYFLQRLQFVNSAMKNRNENIWDVGCGYATTAIFLALNGYKVYGSTIEFYLKEIDRRLQFWKQHGDIASFSYGYEDLFDSDMGPGTYDVIIVQDTLHHLEPLTEAIGIFNRVLSNKGRIVVSEVNGNSIFERLKYYKRRGSKRVVQIYDENLKKHILLGNENIRPLKVWEKEFSKQHFSIDEESLQYIRLFPPQMISEKNFDKVLQREQLLWKKYKFLKEYFFFGVNFIAVRN